MFRQSLLLAWTHITVEPYLFFYTTGLTLSELAQQNLVAEKTCRVNAGFNNTVCDALSKRDLSEFHYADAYVQEEQSFYSSYGRLIQSIFPCFLAMTWGSWGDKNKRRLPPLIIAAFGEFLKSLLLMICILFESVPAQATYLLQILVPAITGGNIVVQMAAVSYLADITTAEERTHRIGVASVVNLLAYPVGYLLSGIIFSRLGFYGIFGTCGLLNLLNVVYLMQFVKESLTKKASPEVTVEKSLSFWALVKDFFDWTHIRLTIEFAFAHVGNRRLHLFVLSLLMLFTAGPIFGEFDIVYLFVRRKFHWNLGEYSLYLTFSSAVAMIALALSTHFLSKVFQFEDYVIGMIVSVFKVISGFLYAFGNLLITFYVASIPDNFFVIANVVVRSSITKLVSDEEQGKINAFTGGIEAFVFCVASSFYSYVYAKTLVSFPGAIYLISVILAVMAFCAFAYQMFLNKQKPKTGEEVAQNNQGFEMTEAGTVL